MEKLSYYSGDKILNLGDPTRSINLCTCSHPVHASNEDNGEIEECMNESMAESGMGKRVLVLRAGSSFCCHPCFLPSYFPTSIIKFTKCAGILEGVQCAFETNKEIDGEVKMEHGTGRVQVRSIITPGLFGSS
jgi:hypothetical protein